MPAGEGRGGSQPEDRCSGPAPPGCPRPRGCGRETWGDGAAGTTFDLPLLRPFPRPKALCVCPRPASKPGLVNTDAGDRKGPARGFTRRKPHTDPTSQTAGLCPRGFTEPLAREALVHQVKGTRGHSQALNATQSTGPNADFSIQTKSTKIKGFRHLEPRRADGAPGTGTHGGAVSPRRGVGVASLGPRGWCGLRIPAGEPVPAASCLSPRPGQTQRGEKGQAGS